ncbi:GntR family transcriptional regulator [Isachenkonia alkalipeptolytica]|uniref:GntR family transcriptional regulator n=1 Tax=Isachenkonia alkalipeptolytica TaxID=2565777 RepID=A0AA43XIK5_9CLOT|nr:GntR family transcriptional regulator [Isachenkonia alkalipeptolytica]NBG87490.1 GntR family transcriptional regulator [Isachenkonia alkalipeptolytica]
MLEIDLKSRLPIYEQLVEGFKRLIMEEVIKTDEKLPSVRSLARELTINPNTIQKAYKALEQEGYIYTVQGRGNFAQGIEGKDQKEKLLKLKGELKKTMAEAIYLGMEKKEIVQLIEEAQQQVGGERDDD